MYSINYQPEQTELRQRLNKFLDTLPTPIEDLEDNYSRIGFFVYFLTIKEGEGVALASSILSLFKLSDISQPSNLDRDLGKMKDSDRIIEAAEGFRLHRKEATKIEVELKGRQKTVELRKNLSDLLKKIKDPIERGFVEEAVRCFGTRPPAKRATVIMIWIVCINHLQNFIIKNKKALFAFNTALSKGKQRLAKVSQIEDFSELDESVFITRMREAKITDTNIHKLLEERLKFRDSCAHPNILQIPESKVESFVEDIITNILFRFK